MNIPAGHQAVMPYLILDEAARFTDFVTLVFQGKPTFSKRREGGELILHAEIQIGGSTIMFCDATDQWKPQPASLFVYVDNADVAYQKALDLGSTTVMAPSNQEYGRTCGVTDPFGNVWWITSVINKQAPQIDFEGQEFPPDTFPA